MRCGAGFVHVPFALKQSQLVLLSLTDVMLGLYHLETKSNDLPVFYDRPVLRMNVELE